MPKSTKSAKANPPAHNVLATPPVRAALYARFSSDNQREESIDAQVRAIQDYTRRNNLQITKTYVDRAKSATSDKRPEFQRLIADSAHNHIIHKLDRFSRDKYDFAHYKRILKTNGVRLVSVLENLDDSPESLILESVLEGMAAYYSKNLSREVMKGMRETAMQGKHTGGLPPLGYDVDPVTREYVLNPTEAKTVRLIFDLYLRGLGYNQIISELNLRGMVSKKGQPFAKNSLGAILRNEKYAGVYTFNRTIEQPSGGRSSKSKPEAEIIKLPGRIPAIVTPEEFAAVQEKISNNPHSGGRQTAKETYLLSGLVVCGECLATTGHPHKMVGTTRYCGRGKSKYVTYRCNQRHSKKVCTNKEIRREPLESYVIDQLQEKLFNDDIMPLLVEQVNEAIRDKTRHIDAEIRDLRARLADVNQQIANIIDAIAKGYDQPSFHARVEELELNKAKLENLILDAEIKKEPVTVTVEQLQQLSSSLQSHITQTNLPEIKTFLSNFIESVVVNAETVDLNICIWGLIDGGESR